MINNIYIYPHTSVEVNKMIFKYFQQNTAVTTQKFLCFFCSKINGHASLHLILSENVSSVAKEQ